MRTKEKHTPLAERDGIWKVAGYYIKSDTSSRPHNMSTLGPHVLLE